MTAPGPALRFALEGAESTGKSALAPALASELAALTGLRCTWVPEWLRRWCEAHGRTPRAHEQRGIAEHQQALIEQAAAQHDLVVCDTTPLMTAVYSQHYFADHSLDAYALAQQRRCALTLLTALDLPWQPDGLQRDGPQVQAAVDGRVRQMLLDHGLPWSLVRGQGAARLQAALDAVTPVLATAFNSTPAPRAGLPDRRGLFTGLADRQARRQAEQQAAGWTRWACADCDQPDCEHALRRLRGG